MPGRDLKLLALEWLEEGLPADFPCAIVSRAAQPEQQVQRTTLAVGESAPNAFAQPADCRLERPRMADDRIRDGCRSGCDHVNPTPRSQVRIQSEALSTFILKCLLNQSTGHSVAG